jgi:hypothetical protein
MFIPHRSIVKIIEEVIEEVAFCFVTSIRGLSFREAVGGGLCRGGVVPEL